MVQFLESDFGVMKLPIPVSSDWTKENPKEFNEMILHLTNYMDVMWRNGFDFEDYKDGAIWKNT